VDTFEIIKQNTEKHCTYVNFHIEKLFLYSQKIKSR